METVVIDVEDGISHPLDEQICAIVGRELCTHYPGHAWRVDADHRKGLVDILNLSLSGKYGFRIEMKGMFSAPDLQKLAMRAGGEILERYNVSRSEFNADEMNNLPVDETGQTVLPS